MSRAPRSMLRQSRKRCRNSTLEILEILESRTMLCLDHALPSAQALGFAGATTVTASERSTPPRAAAARIARAAAVSSDEVTASLLPAVPALSSRPGAPKTLYLDFDGDAGRRWASVLGIGGYDTLGDIPAYDVDGDVATLSEHESNNIHDIWGIVAEKFSPFQVNVTTVNPGHLNDNVACKVVIGGDGSWYNRDGRSGGGVAQIGGFFNLNESLAYVWDSPDNVNYVGEAVAHEAGHMFGLSHQTQYGPGGTLVDEYYDGYVMGSGHRAAVGGGRWTIGFSSGRAWWDGSVVEFRGLQDDLHILTSGGAAFSYRADDHGNTPPAATIMSAAGGVFSGNGVITTTADVDVFRFTLGAGAAGQARLSTQPAALGAMLDTTLELRRSDGTLLGSANTATYEEELVVTGLAAGVDYYALVRSSGAVGSIGQYTLIADVTGPDDDSISSATMIGAMGEPYARYTEYSGQSIRSGLVSGADPEDFFGLNAGYGRFTAELISLSGDANLELVHDRNENGAIDAGEILAVSNNTGTGNELVVRPTIDYPRGALPTYIRVRAAGAGAANYTLRVRMDRAGQLPGTGMPTVPPRYLFDGRNVNDDYVGIGDAGDWYYWQIVDELAGFQNRLSVDVTRLTGDVALDIARDQNNDGVITSGEVLDSSNNGGISPESLEDIEVTPGRYYIRVTPVNVTQANYRIRVTHDVSDAESPLHLIDAPALVDVTGSNFAGLITDYVGELDDFDIFNVQPIPGPIRIELKGGSAPHLFDLVADLDGDRMVDPGEIIATGDANKPIAQNIPPSIKNLYVRVHPALGQSKSDGGYGLIVKTAFAETSLGTGVNNALLLPANQQKVQGFVGFDPDGDLSRPQTIYAFSLDKAQRFTVSPADAQILIGLSVYNDLDKDGQLEANELIAGGSFPGDTEGAAPVRAAPVGAPPAVPSIDVNLPAGQYYLRAAALPPHNLDRLVLADYELDYAFGEVADTTRPKVMDAKFHYDQLPHVLTIQFSEDVMASPRLSDMLLLPAVGEAKLALLDWTYDPNSHTAAFALDGLTPDGYYTAKLPADAVTDRSGNPLEEDFAFEFFFMMGDANHDASVGFEDLVIVAQNYNSAGRTFSTGDLTYDGKVGFEDLVVLAQRYNTRLLLPAVGATSAASTPEAVLASEPQSLFNSTVSVRPTTRKAPKAGSARARSA